MGSSSPRCVSVPNLVKRHPTPVISMQTQAAHSQQTIPYLQTAVTPPMPAAVPHRTPSTECFQAQTVLTLPPPRASVPLSCAQGMDTSPPTTPTGAGPALSAAGLLVTSVGTRSNEQLPVPAQMCSPQFPVPQHVGPAGALPLSSASQLTTPRTTSHPTPRSSRPMSSARAESPVMTRIITSASNGVYQFDWPHGHADEDLQRRSPSPPHARSGSVSVSVPSFVAVPQTHVPPSQTVRDSRDGLHCSRKSNMPPAPGRKLTPGELHASKPVATEVELRLMRLPSRSGSKTPEGRAQHASVRGRRHAALCCV